MKKQKTKKQNTNKGITLIALVITIIVMLILVAVTITMAINGGLFEYAQNAGQATNEAVANEQLLASGQVTIGNVTYNSIDTYINSSKEFVDIDEISVGDYISNYPIFYSNVSSVRDEENIPSSNYTGWRVLSKEEDDEGNVFVRLISAGIPISYYIPYNDLNGCEGNIEILTTNFLTHSFKFSDNGLHRCGFDMGENTMLENIFRNDYTNKVQSLTKDDIDDLLGSELLDNTDLSSTEYGDLLAIPRANNSSAFVEYWVATKYDFTSSWGVREDCSLTWAEDTSIGVRPVVTLVPEVKFSLADTKINKTTTWEITLED